MRGRGKQREQSKGRDGRSPPAGDSEPGPAEAPRLRREDGGPTGPVKAYMGVRVKRPVRDLLKRVRVDQGWDSQRISGGSVKGDGPKVPTRAVRRHCNRKCSTKSLEELAMILEVLEEDLWTGAGCRSSAQYPPTRNPQGAPFSPGWSSTGSEYYSDESDGVITSPEYPWEPPPPFQPVGARGGGWADGQDHDPDHNVSFFWAQLHWVESRLGKASDGELLAPDHNGRAALHNVARVGKRALGYAIAKRMAALNSLDLKDSDGMTALLHATQHNHHLMVADLILLGANVNETDNSGKTCLHLSAEKGYVRVLEVLKNAMLDGVYVDVEAADHSGVSVFQCASVALRAAVRKLESSKFSHPSSLHALRQEQMMETMECLLQMSSYLHTMVELIVFITHPPSRDLLQLVPVFPSSNRIVPSAVFMCFWLFSPYLSGRV